MGKKNPKHNRKKTTIGKRYKKIEKQAIKLLNNDKLEGIDKDIIKKSEKYKILTKNNLSKDTFEFFKLAGDLLNADIISTEFSIQQMEELDITNQT